MLPHERQLIREIVDLFQARRVRTPDEPACHLCQRHRDDLVVDADGVFWCPRAQWKHCNKVAYARLCGWAGYR
jgi:predicted glycosyltransferase